MEWVQSLDYEHIPFRCRKCNEYGHLFRHCPLNIVVNQSKPREDTNKEGCIKVPSKHKISKESVSKEVPQNTVKDGNSFQVLASDMKREGMNKQQAIGEASKIIGVEAVP